MAPLPAKCFWGIWAPAVVLLCSVVTADAREGQHFDRDVCRTEIIALQQQANFTKNTPIYFLQDPYSGLLSNGSDNMTVTLAGCYEFCGPWTFYWDAVPRLTTWILPVILLLSNIEMSPIDKKRFMTIIHVLGDPIDSFWSLLHKIYIWHRLYAIGRKMSRSELKVTDSYFRKIRGMFLATLIVLWLRLCRVFKGGRPPAKDDVGLTRGERASIIATVLAGFEEIAGAHIESENYYLMIAHQLGRLGEDDEDREKFEEWRRTARILADARTNEFLRTCLAILVYIFSLIAGFVSAIGGGNTTPPGGRIACAIFLSWLLPLALLSNTIGGFTSCRTCLTIMREFVYRTTRLASALPDKHTAAQSDASQVTPTHDRILTVPHSDPQDEETSTLLSQINREFIGRGFISKDDTAVLIGGQDSKTTVAVDADEAQSDPDRTTTRPPQDNYRDHIGQAHRNHRHDSVTPDVRPLDIIELGPITASDSKAKVNWRGTFGVAAQEDVTEFIDASSWKDYFESLQWLGAIYTYRPWKVLYLDIDHRTHAHRKNVMMAVGGILPIAISMIGAFIILWYAVPIGFSCRHLWVLGIFVLWIVSAFFTSALYIYRREQLTGHQLWLIVLVKDVIIGLSSASIIFLSTGGLFNNCWCWSVYMMRREGAYVPLNTTSNYEEDARNIYSIVVGTCIGAQLCLYAGVLLWWRQGVRLVRWKESRRRKEWRYEMHEDAAYFEKNFLLFWYKTAQLDHEEHERRVRQKSYSSTRRKSRGQ